MIILWTDVLLWLTVLLVLLSLIKHGRHHGDAWRVIGASPMAVSTGLICITYIFIALLDSVHLIGAGNQVFSILDWMLSPINQPLEVTYSPPFSIDAALVYPSQHQSISLIVLSIIGLSLALIVMTCLPTMWLAKRVPFHRLSAVTSLMVISVVLASLYILSRHYHIFGTDKVGQDVFYQAVKSIRTGVVIGTLTTLVLLPFALIMGMAAGYFRGIVDDIVQYIYTVLSSIPSILLIVAFVLMFELIMGKYPDAFNQIAVRADFRLLAICLILGITSWTSLCRLLRAETLKIREQDYIKAAKIMGVKASTILYKHIFPNLLHIVLITVVLDFSSLVLAEAVLAYVGVGVDPTTFSWGNMINSARFELARDPVVWWSLLAAFIFMFGLVLSANCFSDVVQKAFDPKTRGVRHG